uniref:Protein PHLOEM PROTEIN 2-LIKE A10 n=1 Tax=Pyramimonas obovata TaxID=1411642 RepID=A0A7S0MV33_9CHLO|mmetsp:Transcript_14195/g.30377  ORF Transcript_14195/g.30377 Transcript_14195/m.30377 type:complete len:444 (+) Transcript_14195:417-1748(+)|eukprot:CAMPEP_0118934458 /NCGR_PEP_ID=MMETSP1169-20130426/13835_1 /TAXON_ID=36882 /ORGANISM="Pyramimonas obovata, Strain CCMP722" /LENGTH=443 /DNA_ID=CAMNT_0006877363 /DNA_START=407 /DNA_END=1738 /DNA_ORIENTATION=+
MELLWKRRRALLATAAVGVAAAYIYRSERARRLARGVCESADAFTKLAEVALALSRDLNHFVIEGGEEDEVPSSVRQALRLAQCSEAESLLQTIARATARGALQGSGLAEGDAQASTAASAASSAGAFASDLTDRVLDRVLSHRTAGIVTTIIGGSVRQCIEAYLDTVEMQQNRNEQRHRARKASDSEAECSPGSWSQHARDGYEAPPRLAYQLLELASSDQARSIMRDVITTFVTTSVGVYLEKTAHCNTVFEDSLRALSKPLHREAVAEVAGNIIRDAIRESVRACHEVVTNGSTPVEIRGGEGLAATPNAREKGPLKLHDSAMSRRVDAPHTSHMLRFNMTPGGLSEKADPEEPGPSSRAGTSSATTVAMDMLRIMGAPEVRLFTRDVVGSAMWGTVRGLTDTVKELAPTWTRSGHTAMPPAVILSVCMSMCLHMSGMTQ